MDGAPRGAWVLGTVVAVETSVVDPNRDEFEHLWSRRVKDARLRLAFGKLGRSCPCRPSPYMNNVLEQDHRFIKKRIAASLWFRSVGGALNTIAGYESMHMIRKGQNRWLAKGDIVGQVRFIHQIYGIAA